MPLLLLIFHFYRHCHCSTRIPFRIWVISIAFPNFFRNNDKKPLWKTGILHSL